MLKVELNIWKPFAVTFYCIFEFYTNRFGPQHTVCKKSILWIRNITCCFWKRSMHYTTRKNITLWDLVQQGLNKFKKRNMGMVNDDHDCDDALMTLTTIYLMMAIVLYQVWEVFATCPAILNDLMIYKGRWDRCSTSIPRSSGDLENTFRYIYSMNHWNTRFSLL